METQTAGLTRQQILACDDIGDLQRVEVPEWNGHVFIRPMSGRDRDRYELAMQSASREDTGVRALIVAAVTVDENGAALFTKGDVERLAGKSWRALDRIVEAALKAGMLHIDAGEEAEKNSDRVSSASGSA